VTRNEILFRLFVAVLTLIFMLLPVGVGLGFFVGSVFGDTGAQIGAGVGALLALAVWARFVWKDARGWSRAV
jgi:hypothetical protein